MKQTLIFKPGALGLNPDGSGQLVFDPFHVVVEKLEHKSPAMNKPERKGVAVVELPVGSFADIRDFLNQHLPSAAPLRDDRVATADRRKVSDEPAVRLDAGPLADNRIPARGGHERRTKAGTIADRMQYRDVAAALAAYALNVVHGATLADFEMASLVDLAARVGCKVADHHRAFGSTRAVLGEVLAERKRQVGLGYTPAHDDANLPKLHDEVLQRVQPMATVVAMRSALVEAAAMIVAEIERLDRKA